jgi:uncharacterized protein
MNMQADLVARDTCRWLERAVIGLNLCPFAKAVYVRGLVHIAVSDATDGSQVIEHLASEIDALVEMDAAVRETTLLVIPACLGNFLEFVDLLSRAERVMRKRRLEGVLQLASFHPEYQFEGALVDDITNCTNRSPYPTLHLLRESSIDRAVQAFPQAETIYEANMDALRKLGRAGWSSLDVGRSI